jgi:microcystin-dependent protein
MWSGSIASIPAGWLLCNGTSGTPDLRNRFIVGAGSTYAVGAIGGTADAVVVSHSHSASTSSSDSGHTHASAFRAQTFAVTGSTIQAWEGLTYTATTTGYANITSSTTVYAAGVSGTNANLPPYYALAYIMKS